MKKCLIFTISILLLTIGACLYAEIHALVMLDKSDKILNIINR
jgi:hypothetical protein